RRAASVLGLDVDHFRMGLDPRAVFDSVGGVCDREPERVHCVVQHADGAFRFRGEVRFLFEGLLARDDVRRNPTLRTAVEFLFEVRVRIALQLDEQSTSLLYAVARNLLENPAFADTIDGAFLVGNGIPRTTVEVTVCPAGRSVGQRPAFDERGFEPTHRQIADDSGTGRSTPDNDDGRLHAGSTHGAV